MCVSVIEAHLKDQIGAARRAASLTQRELAEQLKVSARAVQAWEGGTRSPRPAVMRRLAEVTGKPLAWFYGEGSSANPDQEA